MVSDSHLRPNTRKPLPEMVIEECRSADMILHGGDWHGPIGYDFFCSLGPPVLGVLGNGDEEFGLKLPLVVLEEIAGVNIHIQHVLPGRIRSGTDLVISGHSHRPALRVDEAGVIWLNPGHVCPKRWNEPQPSMAIVELRNGYVEGIEVFHDLI